MPMLPRTQDVRLYYEVHGQGPAILFAHGAGGNAASWWQQVPFFSRAHTVITFDHRGFGRSTCGADDFHPRHFGADVLALLDAADVERAALVCQSMGGWSGMRATLEAPERVACLVMAGTPGGLVTPAVVAALGRIGRGVEGDGVRGQAALAPDFPGREPERAFLYDQINAHNTRFDPRWLARLFDADARIDPARLAGWRTPTLFCSGSEDQLFPTEAIAEAARLIPAARVEHFPGIGHSTYFEAAADFNARVLGFVDPHLG